MYIFVLFHELEHAPKKKKEEKTHRARARARQRERAPNWVLMKSQNNRVGNCATNGIVLWSDTREN